jgi:hypothetical protein
VDFRSVFPENYTVQYCIVYNWLALIVLPNKFDPRNLVEPGRARATIYWQNPRSPLRANAPKLKKAIGAIQLAYRLKTQNLKMLQKKIVLIKKQICCSIGHIKYTVGIVLLSFKRK